MYTVITRDYINVNITNSSKDDLTGVDKRFQKGITILDLKGKLELVTGGTASTMKIEVYNKDNQFVCKLEDDDALFGSYPIDDGFRLHVVDQFALRKEMEDMSLVEKFEMSKEDYNQRRDTLKAYLQENKLGKFNEEEMNRLAEQRKKEEEENEIIAKSLNVEDRCEVTVPGQPTRRAVIMFVGEVEFKEGWWVGVKYDEPLGKNDGSVNGKRYFECQPKYGGFVKPMHVVVGDFPEEGIHSDEEM